MDKLIVSPGFVKKIEQEQDTQDQAITANSDAIANLDTRLNTDATSTYDVLQSALSVTKTTFFKSIGSSYTGTLPNNDYFYSVFTVYVRDAIKYVMALNYKGNVAVNSYNGNTSEWTGWKELATKSDTPQLVVNESLAAGASKTYSFTTGKLYQIMCAHPYGQGYFALYAGGTAGAARLNEIKTSSNVTVTVASNANSVTIAATGQATYVRIVEY